VPDLIGFFFTIGGLVVAVLAGTLWLRSRPLSPHPRRLLICIAAAYAGLTVYAVGEGVGRLLMVGMNPLAPGDVPSGRTAIVVLGSSGFTARDWENGEYSIVDQTGATRALEAVRAFRLVGAEWVISSGGKARPDDRHEASGLTLRDAMVEMGVPGDRVIVETASRNTRDESVIVATMLRELQVQHVVLVTSGTHMRRSLGAFRAQGIRAIPAIARDPYTADSWDDWVRPSNLGLWKSASVVHEILGLAYYTARGWYAFE
jgi:uncharacterized SAM-binding protein YcdF (DUF218 family)